MRREKARDYVREKVRGRGRKPGEERLVLLQGSPFCRAACGKVRRAGLA
jgi:hypothetical protein